MHQIALAVAVMADPADVSRLVAEEVRALLRADRVAIFTWDAPAGHLVSTIAIPEEPQIAPILPGSGAAGTAFQERRPVLIEDYRAAPQALAWAVAHGVRTAAAVPLTVAQQTVGVLLVSRLRPRRFTDEDAEVLSVVGTLAVAPAIELARLRRRVHEGEVQLAVLGESSRELTPGTPRLTRRERQILPLLAQGQTNREIGVMLQLSAGTVRNLVARLVAKLGARDRTHAVVIALGRGMASESDMTR